jgi:hypothetical protein
MLQHGRRGSAFRLNPQSREEEPAGPIIGRVESECRLVTAQTAGYSFAKLFGDCPPDTRCAGSRKTPVSPNGRDQSRAVAKVANVPEAPQQNGIVAVIPADAESMTLCETLDQIA